MKTKTNNSPTFDTRSRPNCKEKKKQHSAPFFRDSQFITQHPDDEVFVEPYFFGNFLQFEVDQLPNLELLKNYWPRKKSGVRMSLTGVAT